SSLVLHGVLMSARACSRGAAPGLRYPDVRTLVVLCRMLGVEPLRSDKRKRGATRHPFREVCAADRERPRRYGIRRRHPHLVPRSVAVRRPTLASGIRYTYAPEPTGERTPGAARWCARSRRPRARVEPLSTLQPLRPVYRTPPIPS